MASNLAEPEPENIRQGTNGPGSWVVRALQRNAMIAARKKENAMVFRVNCLRGRNPVTV